MALIKFEIIFVNGCFGYGNQKVILIYLLHIVDSPMKISF